MTAPIDRADGAALWRRVRSTGMGRADDGATAPDPIELAAYAEGRLAESQCEVLEEWLADHPEAIEDVILARRLASEAPVEDGATDRLAERAAALVAAPARVAGDPKVVPFRRPQARMPAWRAAMMWGGMAASIAVTSLVGFKLGSDTYASFIANPGTSTELEQDLPDTSTGLFMGMGDEASS